MRVPAAILACNCRIVICMLASRSLGSHPTCSAKMASCLRTHCNVTLWPAHADALQGRCLKTDRRNSSRRCTACGC